MVPCSAVLLDLPHALVEWVTMLIVTRVGERRCRGAGPCVTTALSRPPVRGLTPTRQTVNRALSAARAPIERGIARLTSWRILDTAGPIRTEGPTP